VEYQRNWRVDGGRKAANSDEGHSEPLNEGKSGGGGELVGTL